MDPPATSQAPAAPWGGAQIGEDMRFQERWWRAERIAWVAMALFVLAAAAGVFGSGPASRASSTAAGGARLEYPRFLRARAQAELIVVLPAAGRVRRSLVLSPSLLERFEVEALVPPARAARSGEGLHYTLHTEPRAPARAWLRVRARRPGWVDGTVRVDGVVLPLRALVYP